MPTKKQIATAKAIGRSRENIQVAAGILGTTDKLMNMTMTSLFQEFGEDLDLMLEYYPIFKRRFEADPKYYTKLRRLARLVGNEVKST
jgi:hypothetical protein